MGGGNLFTAHTRCLESSRQGKKDGVAELGRVKVQCTSGEFSGIKILLVSSLELSGKTRGAAASGL